MDKAKKILFHMTDFLGKDLLFSVSLLAALLTSLLHRPNPAAIDWKVIVCLFGLMAVVKGLEACGVLEFIASALVTRCRSGRGVLLAVCLLAFVSSMLLTNDVAIMTLLPILFVMGRASGMPILFPAIMVTVCANLGSAATPFGNPQNLFLFSFYRMNAGEFFSLSLPFTALGLLLIVTAAACGKSTPLHVITGKACLGSLKSILAYGCAAIVVILCVLDILPYPAALPVVLLAALRYQRHVLRLVDYRLLLTFAFLFLAIDNLATIPALQASLTALAGTPAGVYLSAALISQIISNVPCAVLLAPFTEHFRALFLGVNVGGLGTLIASMANLIAYKLYVKEYPEKSKAFLKQFTLCNLIFLILLGILAFFVLL